ncbi:MAG TPA: hypothetical protein VIT65_18980 [Microlunatus sp.]
MAKVLGVHEVELEADKDPAEFERRASAFAAEAAPEGLNFRVFKADRGPRNGRYMILVEIDSVEARDRIFPIEGADSAEIHAFFAAHPTVGEAWDRLDSYVPSTGVGTDYVEIAG